MNILDRNGHLLPADRWAMIREQMKRLSKHNQRISQEIDSSIMVICLDEDDKS